MKFHYNFITAIIESLIQFIQEIFNKNLLQILNKQNEGSKYTIYANFNPMCNEEIFLNWAVSWL